MSETGNLQYGKRVYALETHGGIFGRTIRAGHPGRVLEVHNHGKIVIEWDNGKTRIARLHQITTEVEE